MDQLEEMVSEVVGVPITVTFRGLEPNMWGQADLAKKELRLSPSMLKGESCRTACGVFLHELCHLMEGHRGQKEDQEHAADKFADDVIKRTGATWFAQAVKGSMLQRERQAVLGAIEAAASRQYRAKGAHGASGQSTSLAGKKAYLASLGDTDMERRIAEFDQQKALFDRWEKAGKLPAMARIKFARSIVARGRQIMGEPQTPATMEYIGKQIAATKGRLHGRTEMMGA